MNKKSKSDEARRGLPMIAFDERIQERVEGLTGLSATDLPEHIRARIDFWTTPRIRFRELLEITMLERGYVQGIEQRGLWKYSGPEKGTGRWRSYSPKDLLAFTLSKKLTGAGFEAEDAWGIIKGELNRMLVDCGILRTMTEYSFARNALLITIPAAEIIDGLTVKILRYFNDVSNLNEGAFTAHVIMNENAEPEG